MKESAFDAKAGCGLVRVRAGSGPRRRLWLLAASAEEFESRARRLRAFVSGLVGVGRWAAAASFAEDACAEKTERGFGAVERAALDLAAAGPERQSVEAVTYREVVRCWLSGELSVRHRGDVPKKGPRSVAQDWSVYNLHILPALGDMLIATVTLEACEEVKAKIAERYRDNTFSRYCRLIRRPLELAEYPLKLIERNPVPAKFVPPAGKSRERTYLYPEESATFLAATERDLEDRIVWGLGERNGGRPGEVANWQVGDVDFEHGTITLDHNKTKSPRQWKAELDTLEALRIVRDYFIGPDAGPEAYFFPAFRLRVDKAARTFQGHFKAIGLDRRELLTPKDPSVRKKICAHDWRATFVTRAKASRGADGRPTHRADEHWIRDRTGHTTTKEMDRYRRAARFAVEHGHCQWFDDLVGAIPELWRLAELEREHAGLASAGREAPGAEPSGPGAGNTGHSMASSGVGPSPQVGQEVGQNGGARVISAAGLFPSPKEGGGLVQPHAPVSADLDARASISKHSGPPQNPEVGQSPDHLIELCLERATAAKQWDLAAELIAELRERRRSRTSPDIASLDDARARRR